MQLLNRHYAALLFGLIVAPLSQAQPVIKFGVDPSYPPFETKQPDGSLSGFDIDFSNKIYTAPSSLVARKNSGLLPTPQSLEGKSVGVVQGSLHESYAKTQWGRQGVNILSYQTQDQVFSDLINGRLDAAFQASVQADIGLLQKPQGQGFAFAGEP